ncbi:SMP-30/gluconolactonase/LRE family protein [Halomonas sp. ISL-60]|uniref:SMP-30/gluconolactonase/LRE family protein n=1 Tax=Halomonas sp. ISL-56 TaxID=2819149 RepID=UPI001BE78A2A|nr:SMP-30/gluconolactonase/LRE family protein [Halomonas sp. ISL-56]MBT2771650.1 SMP-30/gluconolactonase/LRE family protein [Halomonas sp. ISL-60]MBT2803141.1 SMP-30/gluconolactonase/LRE family protein [Halomonas sp. ISL-56]
MNTGMHVSTWQAELAVDCRCTLGEGPQWDAKNQRLYWCDILEKQLHWLSPASGESGHFQFDHRVSLAAPLEEGGLLLVGEDRLSRFDPDSGKAEKLCDFEADNPVTRSNDARIDRHGSLWLSSMGKSAERNAGSLYRLHRGELSRLRTGLTIPNAICFAENGEFAWFTDTVTGVVMRWALDSDGWPQGEPQPWADFFSSLGNPDGAVMDSEGCLWLALWGAGQVVRLDHDGQIIGRVELPVSQPSCPAFAGPDLKTLYITTAQEGFSAEQLAQELTAGSLYVVETGIKGLAEPPLRLA